MYNVTIWYFCSLDMEPSSKRGRQDDSPTSPLQSCDKTTPLLQSPSPTQFYNNPPMLPVKPSETAGRQGVSSVSAPTGQLMFSPVNQQFYPPWGSPPSWTSDRDADDESSSSFSRTEIGLMVSNVHYTSLLSFRVASRDYGIWYLA